MKKIGLVLSLVLFFSVSFQVNAQWFWQNPLPQGNTILDSYFLDNNNGWAVGRYGACTKTTDGGETWEHIQVPIHSTFISVNFLNTYIGYIGDQEGNLLKTTDGGNNWSVQQIDTYADINVFFIDQNYGWLLSSGTPNKIYRTSDGGTNWQPYLINTTHFLNDIIFTDTSHGFVIGNSGEILMTYNGGINWTHINSPTTAILLSIKFKNSFEGFIVGNFGTLLKTIDAGINWQLSFIGSDLLSDIDFLDNNRGMIVGGKIYFTSNGGSTWVDKTFGSLLGLSTCNYLNETDCVIFGERGNIYKSTSNGNDWESKLSGERNNLKDIVFVDNENGYIIGSYGLILKTVDGGKNWEKMDSVTNESLNGLYFINRLNGWIVGSNSILLRSINGGQSWQIDTIPGCNDLYSIFFLTNDIGWAAGENNKILKSLDGGETWDIQQINASQSFNINSLSILDKNIGYACGFYYTYLTPKGIVLKTTNGGLNWDSVKTDNSHFNSVLFLDQFNGWVVGSSRTFHTTNGGNSWITPDIGGGNDIFFSNNLNGIKIESLGYKSNIRITKDGGETWSLPQIVTDNDLYSAYADLNNFWTVGSNGTILFSNSPIITEAIRINYNSKYQNQYCQLQNYPNPFNPSTKISWQVPVSGWQTLKVYDILGNEVATLVNEYRDAGSYNEEFTINNLQLSSGVYFYQLRVGDFVETKKMILLK